MKVTIAVDYLLKKKYEMRDYAEKEVNWYPREGM